MTVWTGSSPHGQGHATAWAMLVQDELGVPMDRVTVRHGDTDELADESKQSPKVLTQAIVVARNNHQVSALCDRLRAMPDQRHGTCFDALLSVMHSR